MAVFCAYITYLSTCCQISFTVSSALRPFVNAASDEFLNLFHICSSCVGSVHLKLLKHYVLLCFSEQIVDLFGSRLEYLGNLVYIFPRKPSSSKPNSSSVLYVYSAIYVPPKKGTSCCGNIDIWIPKQIIEKKKIVLLFTLTRSTPKMHPVWVLNVRQVSRVLISSSKGPIFACLSRLRLLTEEQSVHFCELTLIQRNFLTVRRHKLTEKPDRG